ncbi:MAG TPA: hypothetical protein VF808_09090 [Ktedonobacterales bacterium]
MRATGRGAGLVMALALLALLVAGCSTTSGGGGINFNLGLQGATNDHPAAPPQIAASGPDREYAFVYDNQIWVRQKGAGAARQVTQLTLSAGADLVWGPLVWSPSGASLAFALVQDLAPASGSRSSGPIYYVDVSQCLNSTSAACTTYQTPMTGSVYGHTYTWYKDALLIAGGGGGLSAYDVGDPNGPRVWQLRTTQGESQDSSCQQPSAYGDAQVVGTNLYYTCMTLPGLGKTGAIGQAYLYYLSLNPYINATSISDAVSRDVAIANAQNGDQFYGNWFSSLGNVYSDSQGNAVAGAWSIGGITVTYEQIGHVDAKAAKAHRTVCVASVYYGACQATLGAVGDQPLAIHAVMSVGPGGAVAYQGASLFATRLGKPLDSTSTYAPQWVSGDTLLVTSVLSTSTDASGVTRQVTSAQLANGSSLSTLIAGASDVALR